VESSTITIAPYFSARSQIAVELGDVAVHREHAVGGDQRKRLPCVAFRRARARPCRCWRSGSARLAQADAVDDRGVVERVGDDRVLLAEQRLEQAAVGVEARRVEDRVLGAEEAESLASSSLWMSCVPQMKRTDAMPKP
jgi:hypothetical protein